MRCKNFLLFVFLIFFIGIVSASFQVGNKSYDITSQYSPEDNLKGWINLSLQNEPSNSAFEDSLGNKINLINLLKASKNKNTLYTCSIKDCASDYSASNRESEKNFNLDIMNSKLVGFKLTGNNIDILNITFTVVSSAPASCTNQLKIDFLNNNDFEKANTKSINTSCEGSKNYGCFNENITSSFITLKKFPVKNCQRIKLSESPAFNLGAWVENSKNLKMALYDLNGDKVEDSSGNEVTCALSNNITGETSCSVDYLITEKKEYYVCIYSIENSPTSKIKGYSSSNGCGFEGISKGSEIASYKIFAEGKAFDSIGSLAISNSLPNDYTLSGLAQREIIEKNYNKNCSNGCIIPIKFVSGKSQDITLKNLEIKYDLPGVGTITENNFYDLTETPAKINMGFQKIYLDEGNFTLPSNYGNISYYLNLNGNSVFSGKIIIERVPIIESLYPLKTTSAFPTEFTITVSSLKNITGYKWNFGDSKIETTTTKRVIHSYNSTGKYNLEVTITDKDKKTSSKIFEVTVESPKELINTTLKEKLENLDNVTKQIDKFDAFYQKSLNSALDIQDLEDGLEQIQRDYKTAEQKDDPEAEYSRIANELLNLKIPKSISITKKADSILLFPDKNKINLEILKTIGGSDYEPDEESKYLDAIILLNMENITTKITFREFSALYKDSNNPFLKIFELDIQKKIEADYPIYFIIKELNDLNFDEDILEKEESGYAYIELKNPDNKIMLSTTEDIDFTELPAFISPDISELEIINICEGDECGEPPKSKWTTFALIIFLLVIIGLIVYLILQEWYKRKYENHLFKNRNNLYNLLIYIENSRGKGIKDKDIEYKLKKAGWNSEQIRYAMRKHAGKITGMIEIPILNLFKKLRKRELDKQKAGFPPNYHPNKTFEGGSY